jgi:DNA-binding beta-propeller fold protein YncE
MRPVRFGANALAAVAAVLLAAAGVRAAEPGLELERKIPLGAVSGRIDHLAVDLERKRLFVAELGNDTVGVVDLAAMTMMRTLTGFREPQGIGYVRSTDEVYVANAGDGSVHVLGGGDLSSRGRIELGNDADNVRIDVPGNRVFIGYGKGSLAVIDAKTRVKIGNIPLKAHPESFQLELASGRAFVNVPDAGHVAVVDIASARQIAAWQPPGLRANFPMAVDSEGGQVFVAYRRPARLLVFDGRDGAVLSSLDLCDDSDDVFLDGRRRRLYASCGAGSVDVFAWSAQRWVRAGRVPTVSGSRTSLFVPELDRLFVAARASGREPAALWVFRTVP